MQDTFPKSLLAPTFGLVRILQCNFTGFQTLRLGTIMIGEKLVHTTEIELDGDRFEILVYCCDDGRHFAKTHFGENDIIINDGSSLEEALAKHERLLPLAVTCRLLKQEVKGNA